MKTIILAACALLLTATVAPAQGVSMGAHYSGSGPHPHVSWALELRGPALGPVTPALTHAALSNTRPVLDRSALGAIVALPGPLRVIMGAEITRVWLQGSCGPTGYECQQEWHAGPAYGLGLTVPIAGARLDLRYMRFRATPAARGALVALLGFDMGGS